MSTGFRFSPSGRQRLAIIDQVLEQRYGAPEAVLGNQHDPLDETVYTILGFQTDVPRLRETWAQLRSAFPSWLEAEQASSEQLAACLRPGGLHHQKARTIGQLLNAVRAEFGVLSLSALEGMSDELAETLLLRLPGLSLKGGTMRAHVQLGA